MRISSTVDIFKLGVGNYKSRKLKLKNLRNTFEHNLHIFNEFVICWTLLNVGIVEQTAEAGQKVHNSN